MDISLSVVIFTKTFIFYKDVTIFQIFNPAMATKLVRQCRYCQNHFLGSSVHQLTPRLNFNALSKNNAKSAKEIKEEDIRADVDMPAKKSVKVLILLNDHANEAGRIGRNVTKTFFLSGLYCDRVARVV